MTNLHALARAAVEHLRQGNFKCAANNANAIYTKSPTQKARAWQLAVLRVRGTLKVQEEAAIAALWPPPNFGHRHQALTQAKRKRRGPNLGASPRLTSGDSQTARASKILFLWAQGWIGRDDAFAWLRQVGALGLYRSWTNPDGIEKRDHWRSPWAMARNGKLNDYPPLDEAPRLAQELWKEARP